MKILVVDDNLVIRTLIQKMLTDHGEVDGCADGAEAVKAYRRSLASGHPYDLICLDIHMPGMGGLEVLHVIREAENLRGRTGPKAAKVIMATCADDQETVAAALHEGCNAYLIKPVRIDDLLSRVRSLFPNLQPQPAS
jgi:two-component system, chemotaxis family, chemotaxis protein CheY